MGVAVSGTLDLFGWSPPTAASTPDEDTSTIDQRFEAFHQANPHIAAEMLRLARLRLDRGETFISTKALWEELRVSLDRARDLGASGAHVYKLNNDYTSLYSRLLIRLEPKLEGVIQIRKRKSER